MSRTVLFLLPALIAVLRGDDGALTNPPRIAMASCATSDSAAAQAVRNRLETWVRQTNTNDMAGAREVWAPNMVGWFPGAPVFSDSAAATLAGATASGATVRYEITIDDIAASGSLVAVHDIWTEIRTYASSSTSVRRTIRGSELWRCQPDGRWRIARFVSAPEPWVLVRK